MLGSPVNNHSPYPIPPFVQGIEHQLLKRSNPSQYLYIAERIHGNIDHKMDHLVCFYPGKAVQIASAHAAMHSLVATSRLREQGLCASEYSSPSVVAGAGGCLFIHSLVCSHARPMGAMLALL